jgi:tetratricopeptide (TPR) repeat protein
MNDRRLRLGLAGLLFLFVFVAYIETMASTASFWDCGEFIATAYTLGIPHPPATPLYVVLGRVFTLLPLPLTIAQKVNFVSALFGALGIAVLFLIVVELLRQQRGNPRTTLDRIVVYGSALVGSLFTAWSNTYWSNAVEAEVYSIASFVMGLTTLLALRWSRDPDSPQSTRYIYLIIYLLSLCVGFHLGTVLTYPAIILFILLFRKRSVSDADLIIFSIGFFVFLFYVTLFKDETFFLVGFSLFLILLIVRLAAGHRFVAVASMLFFLGLTIHFFLLIRSGQNPAIDEANPENFDNLLRVLKREQYPPSNPLERKASWEFQVVGHFWRYFTEQYELSQRVGGWFSGARLAIFPILVGAIGFGTMAAGRFRNFVLVGGTFLITSVGMIFFLNFSDTEVRERDYFYSPAFYFFGIFIGVGAAALLDFFFGSRRERPARIDRVGYVAGVAILLLLTFMLYQRYHFEHDRTGERVPWGYGYNMLAGLEPNALIFTNGDNDTFPLWFQQEVEGFRTDVRVINLSLLNTTWYPKQLRDNEPRVALTWDDRDIELLPYHAVQIWREQQVEYQPRDLAVIQIVRDNYGKKPIYFAVTIPQESLRDVRDRLVLEGLVYRFQAEKGEDLRDHDRIADNVDRVYRFDGILTADGKHDASVYRDHNQEVLVQNYAGAFIRLGAHAEQLAERAPDDSTRQVYYREAERRYKQALEISPGFEALQVLLGNLYIRMGARDEAEQMFRNLITETGDDRARFELARLQLLEERYDEAIATLAELVRRNPDDVGLHQLLLETLVEAGRIEQAEALIANWEARRRGEPALRDYYQFLRSGGLSPQDVLGGDSVAVPLGTDPQPTESDTAADRKGTR